MTLQLSSSTTGRICGRRITPWLLGVVISLAAGFAPVSAQTPLVNPTAFQFDQSDYLATTLDSTGATVPVIVSFVADFYLTGGTAPVQSTPFAKALAAPQAGTTYRVLFSALPSYPIGPTLQLRLRAVGQPGTAAGVSALSTESFTKPAPAPAVPQNLRIVQ